MIEPRDRPRSTSLKDYAWLVPNLTKLVARLIRDPRVPARSKALMVFVVAYLLSPIDIIPDFLPGLGQLDDLLILALALNQLLGAVPEAVLLEHWDGESDLLQLVCEILHMSTGFVPGPLKRLFSSS